MSLQNNSAGTRSFGTLGITTPSGIGFLHANGGGNVTVTGAATITNPGGSSAVDIQAATSTTNLSFQSGLTVTKTNGTAVVLGTPTANNVAGTIAFNTLNVTASNGTALLLGTTPISATGGTVSATGGPAINSTGTAFNATFGSVSSSGSPTQGITLTNATGSLVMNGGSIPNAGGTAFNLSGGTATVTYAGSITQNAAQFAVAATGMTGGTKTFSGAITSTTSGKGVSLTSNTGATVAFTGGLNLSTGANPAFTATGGGTVTASQNNTSIVNTLTTTTGTALNVANTTIGAAGLRSAASPPNRRHKRDRPEQHGRERRPTVTGNGLACTPADTTVLGRNAAEHDGRRRLRDHAGRHRDRPQQHPERLPDACPRQRGLELRDPRDVRRRLHAGRTASSTARPAPTGRRRSTRGTSPSTT